MAMICECELFTARSTTEVWPKIYQWVHGWLTDYSSTITLCIEIKSMTDSMEDYHCQLVCKPNDNESCNNGLIKVTN